MDNVLNDIDDLKRAAEAQAKTIVVEAIPLSDDEQKQADDAKAKADGAQAFALFARFAVSLVIRRLERSDPKWKPEPGEADAIADALGPVLDKYLPGWLDKYGAEVALAVAIGMYAMPRLAEPNTPKDKAAKKSDDKPEARS